MYRHTKQAPLGPKTVQGTRDNPSKVEFGRKTHKESMSEGQHNGTDRQRSGVSSGKKFTGRQVLGKIEELGDLVYKIGSENQADMFIRTTEGIGDYVGVKYGWDQRMLVKNRVEPKFTKPVHPTEAQVTTRSQAAKAAGEAAEVVSSAELAEFKAELDN